MQNDKNNETKLTRSELLAEIEKQKAIIERKAKGESIEDIIEAENSLEKDADKAQADSNSDEACGEVGKRTVLGIIGKALYIAFAVILSLILVANVYTILARNLFKNPNPTIFGVGYAVVLTDSMNGNEPDSIPGNSLIFTKRQKSYEVGDVITFETGKTASVTHRIIAVEDGKFVTKGDANNTEDKERIEEDAVIGRVFWTVKGAGGFIRALTTPVGLLILSVLCLAPVGIPYLFGYYDEEE